MAFSAQGREQNRLLDRPGIKALPQHLHAFSANRLGYRHFSLQNIELINPTKLTPHPQHVRS